MTEASVAHKPNFEHIVYPMVYVRDIRGQILHNDHHFLYNELLGGGGCALRLRNGR